MKNIIKSVVSTMLVLSMCFAPAVEAYAATYDDYNTIVNTGVNIHVSNKLNIGSPANNYTTTAASYYITGSSNPDIKLYMNGQEITERGIYGSFGVNVALAVGVNSCTFTQGENSKTVNIKRVSSSSQLPVALATRISSQRPSVDDIIRPGANYTLRCTAPSGASVSAVVGGTTIPMKQAAAASQGVAAVFNGSFTAPAYTKITDLGAIQYIMNYNGASSTVNSAGHIYVSPEDKNVVVRVNQAAALTYDSNASNANFKETLKFGATDYVVGLSEYAYQKTEDVFKISTGWIPKQCVKVLPKITNCFNNVSNIRFEKNGNGEQLVLTGTGQSDYQVTQTPETITFTLYNTSGFNSASVNGSSIFSGVTVTPGDRTTKITLDKKSPTVLWGYTVEYNNNETILYFKKKPKLSNNSSAPLKGITVALDAGHGGNDSGAVGVSGGVSSTEKDLTLAAVIATSKRLEALGAKVIIPRNNDLAMTMDERMNISEAAKADFFISMHYNSIGTGINASSAKGIEVYYYQDEAKNFATNMGAKVSASTGRNNRGAKFSNYRVTLNTYAPSVLIELGFICNPVEYDNICNPNNLYNTANGVADAIIATLK